MLRPTARVTSRLTHQYRGEIMSSAESVLQLITDNDVEFVIFRFTDPRGKWQQMRQHRGIVNAETFDLGVMMDGSSIAGWQGDP